MSELNKIIPEIIEAIKSLEPYKIILFGSLSKNNPELAHDIDIAVILNSDEFPASFEDRMKNAILVEELLFDFSSKYPLDITVYTKAEFNMLNKQDHQFIREINSGKILYDLAS
jgi:predicted nucleotidyltransferase